MKSWISLCLMVFVGFPAFAQQVMKSTRVMSCNAQACTRILSDEIHRSNLSPSIMAFGAAELSVFAKEKPDVDIQTFLAEDGYYDMAEDVVILRGIRGQKFHEVIVNLVTNSVQYF
ncbi:MAG: hypothetical protein AB7F86_03895 [Bdellovibrionales bacterium]